MILVCVHGAPEAFADRQSMAQAILNIVHENGTCTKNDILKDFSREDLHKNWDAASFLAKFEMAGA